MIIKTVVLGIFALMLSGCGGFVDTNMIESAIKLCKPNGGLHGYYASSIADNSDRATCKNNAGFNGATIKEAALKEGEVN